MQLCPCLEKRCLHAPSQSGAVSSARAGEQWCPEQESGHGSLLSWGMSLLLPRDPLSVAIGVAWGFALKQGPVTPTPLHTDLILFVLAANEHLH